MDIKQQIVEALTNSLSPDNQKLKQATTFLTSLRDRPSYCLALMQIADSSNSSIKLRQSALVQLKNAIRYRWNSTQNIAINEEQKNIIKSTLLTAIIRCNGQMKLVKLYKEILKIIVSHDYNKWNPISFIVEKLRALQDVQPLLHCLIAVGSAFEIRLNDDEKNYFNSFIRIMLPQVANVVKNKQTPEVVYLVIKLLWKCIHFEQSLQIKKMSLQWMLLLKNVILMKNEKFDKLSQEELDFQDPMTQQFFYFHSKKWSLRIVDIFIQKLAKLSLSKKKKHAIEFSHTWYKQFGEQFVQIVFKQLAEPAGNKTRFFQFKIFKSLLSENPKLLKKYAEKLQYEVLLKYMRLTPEDEELVKENPIEFLSRQDDPLTYQYLKSTCTTIWIGISQIESEQPKKQKPYKPGTFFESNILFLKTKLQGTDLIDKQLAMYLICKLQTTIKKSSIRSMLPKLIKDYVIPQFTSKISFLRARALEIFDDYGELQFDEETLKVVAEKIYICLTQDTQPIVHIKAAIAFKKILDHQCVRILVKPHLKDILGVYLQILDKYDLQNVVDSLKTIVQQFSSDVGPYAFDLGQCLIKMFIKLAEKDKMQSTMDEYNGQSQLAAGGCLSAIKQIIDSPLDKQAIAKLEPGVIDLIYYVFIKTETDYIDDILALLSSYLYKIETITEKLWELFPIMIYNIIGLPKQIWDKIESLNVSDHLKKVLIAIKHGGNYQLMEPTTLVLRNYIRKGADIILTAVDPFGTNFFRLMFQIIQEIYNKGVQIATGQIQMDSCTALLINWIQNKQELSEQLCIKFWQVAEYNIFKTKSQVLKVLNSQLISMMIWAAGDSVIEYLKSLNKLDAVFKQLTSYTDQIVQQHQRQRLILGLSTLVCSKKRYDQTLKHFPALYGTLVRLVKQNIEVRLQENPLPSQNEQEEGQDSGTQEDQEEILQKILAGGEDEGLDQCWEQYYGENYSSKLDDIDQLDFFKNVIQKIEREQPNFYKQMLTIIPIDQLNQLGNKLQKAISSATKRQ